MLTNKSRNLLLSALALVAIAGTAAAAVTIAYGSSSQGLTVKSAPVVWEAGADAAVTDYVPTFTLSANATSYTMTVRGIPEVPVTMSDLIRLKNTDTRTHTVTLATTQITNANVLAYKLDFYDGTTLVGTLDFKSASPSVTFTNLAAGKTLTAQATISLAGGAGANNVADSRTITATVSS